MASFTCIGWQQPMFGPSGTHMSLERAPHHGASKLKPRQNRNEECFSCELLPLHRWGPMPIGLGVDARSGAARCGAAV